MNTLETIKNTRTFVLESINNLTADQLNEVPSGFNNNIIWNLGHLVAAQQGLCYLRSGLKPIVGSDFLSKYRPGTKPEAYVNNEEIETIKKLMFDTLLQLEVDFKNNVFIINYDTFKTRYGVEISNVSEAIEFLLFHEGIHSGYIMALKRLVVK